jgi:hypothetical protein
MMKQNGILDDIKNIVGEEIGNEIEKTAYDSNIFVLYIATIENVTQKDLEDEYTHSYKVKFPERTFEQFMRYKRDWNKDKYRFAVEPQGYFLDENTAVKYVKANMGDINESGSFPYAIVSSMPLNCVYPTANIRTHRLFRYTRDTDTYDEVSWEALESTRLLLKYGQRGGF